MLKIAFTILMFGCALAVGAQTPGPLKLDQGETEVMATIARWADAVRDRDQKALDQLFEDEMIVTAFDGTMRGKQAELDVLKPDANVRTLTVTNEDIRIRRFEKTAIATATTRMEFLISEKPVKTAFRYTAVFVKKENRWQIVALQTTRLPAATVLE